MNIKPKVIVAISFSLLFCLAVLIVSTSSSQQQVPSAGEMVPEKALPAGPGEPQPFQDKSEKDETDAVPPFEEVYGGASTAGQDQGWSFYLDLILGTICENLVPFVAFFLVVFSWKNSPSTVVNIRGIEKIKKTVKDYVKEKRILGRSRIHKEILAIYKIALEDLKQRPNMKTIAISRRCSYKDRLLEFLFSSTSFDSASGEEKINGSRIRARIDFLRESIFHPQHMRSRLRPLLYHCIEQSTLHDNDNTVPEYLFVKAVKYLIAKGENIFWRDASEHNNTLLHIAVDLFSYYKICKKLLTFLLEKTTLDVNAVNFRDSTPLHFASSSPVLLKALLDKNANLYAQNESGRTCLHYAAEELAVDAVCFLCNFSLQKERKKGVLIISHWLRKVCRKMLFPNELINLVMVYRGNAFCEMQNNKSYTALQLAKQRKTRGDDDDEKRKKAIVTLLEKAEKFKPV